MRPGPETFERKSDADKALVMIEALMASGSWTDPERREVKLEDYGRRGSCSGLAFGLAPSTCTGGS
jgi:hypothetical protein